MKKSLTGEWRFCATDETIFRQADVPGCQYLDLMKNGVIDDPFAGLNEQKVQWIHDKDYLYCKTFGLSADEYAAARIDLVCAQLDTIAEIRLNGHVVGMADNCHKAYRFAVKDVLQVGENELSILFFSPKNYVENKRKQQPTPPNANGQNGIVHIRKPQCHFGWDWGPVLIPVGIGGDIYLDIAYAKHLDEPTISTHKTQTGFAVDVSAPNADIIRLTHPDGTVFEQAGEHAAFAVDNPQLWWTRELSGKETQPLYTVEAIAVDGTETLRQSKQIGLRTIELNREKDEYGYNFQFILNGVPLFIKGANYIPPDCFMTRFDQTRLDALLDAVQFANLNMLRVWGGGYYADDALLSSCDKRGILVWQDCMFACQAYPFFDSTFLANVMGEIEYNVRRMASHPCLALWCGNNEIEAMHLAWATMPRYVEWTEKFFYHLLPAQIARFDAATPYIPGSPFGSAHNKDVDADFVGDTHLWGVWHGLKPMTYYRRRLTRFCSEFGFESLPSYKTLASYAEPHEYALSHAVQRSHQKCAGGNDKMLYYIASRFCLSNDINDLIYLSQITQQTCIWDATEHWRRHKGRCNGAMYWQFDDCWPTCSWSGYDYLGQYKALQYGARRFNAPLTASIQDEKDQVTVHILNDYPTEQTVEMDYCVFDFVSPPDWHRTTHTVPPLGHIEVAAISTARIDAKRNGIAVRLWQNGVCLVQKTCLLLPEKRLALPTENIDIQTETLHNQTRITLHSAVYQRFVMVQDDDGGHYSDNFFDLLPHETKVIYKDGPIGAPLRVKTVTTLHKAGWLKTLRAKIKVFLSAKNIANALYHGRVPKPYRPQ